MAANDRFNNDLRRRPADHPSQTHLTPEYVLGPVREALGGQINLDPCTTADNPVGALYYFTAETDGLAHGWCYGTVFVNPPYGEARNAWVERCIETAETSCKVVLLIPSATDTRIFQKALRTASAVVFIRGRLKFGTPRPNGRQVAASHPSALIGWNVDLAPCAHLGALVQLR